MLPVLHNVFYSITRPLKRHKKRYADDLATLVPARTAYRWKKDFKRELHKKTATQTAHVMKDTQLAMTTINREADQDTMSGVASNMADTNINTLGYNENMNSKCSAVMLNKTDYVYSKDNSDGHLTEIESLADRSSTSESSCNYTTETDSSSAYEKDSSASCESDSSSEFESDSFRSEMDHNSGIMTSSDSEEESPEFHQPVTKHSDKSDTKTKASMLLSCFTRNNLSASACKDILETFKTLCPQIDASYLNYKTVWASVEQLKFKEFHYCVECSELFPEDTDHYQCAFDGCQGLRYKGPISSQMKSGREPRHSFILADVGQQLINMLCAPGILLLFFYFLILIKLHFVHICLVNY